MQKKIILQEQVTNIIQNLDEVIMTKSGDGLNYCNKNGLKILDNINSILISQEQQSHKLDKDIKEILNDKFLEKYFDDN